MILKSLSLICVLVLVHVLTTTNGQITNRCRPPLCDDCFDWCPGSVHLCDAMTFQTLCPLTCNACVTSNPVCTAAGCEHNCEIQQDGRAVCSCQEGYRLVDEKFCVDIDECAEDPTLCDNEETNQLCRNDMGGYTCTVCQSRENLGNYYEQPTCCKLNNEVPKCGKSFSNSGRVVNGTLAQIGFWPWMAYIVIQEISGEAGLCGGTLISDRWVLSAAHCFESIRGSADYHRVDIGLGIVDSISRTNVHQQQFRLAVLRTHDNYNFPENDVAVLRLHRRATLGRFVNVICMPNGEQPKTGELCFATGYGATAFGAPAAEGLQEVDLPITDIEECAAVYEATPPENPRVNVDTMICAGNREGTKDTCQGDSGGPLVCQRCNNCDWYIAGITSFGIGCARPGFYGVYSNVEYHENWIAANTDVGITKGNCIKPSWTAWGAWTDCPVTCGGGVRQRIRFCQNGVQGDPGCLGEDIGMLMCNINSCEDTTWGQWGEYTECSMTCGEGMRSRSRDCLVEDLESCPTGGGNQEIACNNGVCPSFGMWGTWNTCSKTCEEGMRTRERACNAPIGGECSGMATQQGACNQQECPVWGPFSEYGPCDNSCGGGQQRRTRECLNGSVGDVGCIGRDFVQRDCNPQTCPTWSLWTTWADCSETCGPGTQSGSRMCQNGDQGQNGCLGSTTRSRSCTVEACPGEWSEWGECSLTCRTGQQIRSRTTATGNLDQTRACTEAALCPTLSAWSTWSDCTEECGTGRQMSERTCNNGNFGQMGCTGNRMRERDCNTFDCPTWSVFGPYGDCDVSCGGGARMRSRTCEGGNPEGTGCTGRATMSDDCNSQPCPTWGEFGEFGDCDVTCGGGMQTSMRGCTNGVPGDDGCRGPRVRRRGCNNQDCPVFSEWSEFGDCSESCGGGTRERSRSCPQGEECPSDEFGTSVTDSESCNEEECPGVWTDWEAVGECTETCGEGSQREERVCTGGRTGGPGCPGEDNRVVSCNVKDCPVWAQWSGFGECSETCGDGTETRNRVCTEENACQGDDVHSQPCNLGDCEDANGCNLFEDRDPRCRQFVELNFCFHRSIGPIVVNACPQSCCREGACTSQYRNNLPQSICGVVTASLCATSISIATSCELSCNCLT